jgi:hypothetical protein
MCMQNFRVTTGSSKEINGSSGTFHTCCYWKNIQIEDISCRKLPQHHAERLIFQHAFRNLSAWHSLQQSHHYRRSVTLLYQFSMVNKSFFRLLSTKSNLPPRFPLYDFQTSPMISHFELSIIIEREQHPAELNCGICHRIRHRAFPHPY